jgi:hypothetical protein
MSAIGIFRQLQKQLCDLRWPRPAFYDTLTASMKSAVATAALFVVGAAATVSAQAPSIGIIWAGQPDTPLRVVRVTSMLTNPIVEIAVKNSSKQQIVSYQLGWVPVVPPGCGAPVRASVKLLPVVQGPVWPGWVGESAHAYEFDRGEILELARKWDSHKIVLEVGVVEVEFSQNQWWRHSGDDLLDPVPVQRFACTSGGIVAVTKDQRKPPPELIGTWDYTSMTALKKGKPFGTVNFQPDQWTVTFNPDATWAMKPPSPPAKPGGLNGSYAVHGHDVDMKLGNGSSYQKYHFTIGQDGNALTLTTKDSIISASREK